MSFGQVAVVPDARSPLRRQLDEGPPPTPLDAFRVARSKFQDGQRIEMGNLAAELGINRVTLYRWVGTREALLVEIVWSLARPALELEYERASERGGARVAEALMRFTHATLQHPGMQRFLEEEGELAMRLLTSAGGGFQSRIIALIEDLLRREADAGALRLPVDLHEMAFVLVRLIESYVYTPHITGERPDPDRVKPILQLLLAHD